MAVLSFKAILSGTWMDRPAKDLGCLEESTGLAKKIAAAGQTLGLPAVAVCADFSNPAPMLGADGRPLAETLFQWLQPEFKYWEDRGFALRSAFVYVARHFAEPFFFENGTIFSWRDSKVLDHVNAQPIDDYGVTSAIICPVYLSGGAKGAVVWASADQHPNLRSVFEARAAELQALALRCLSSYQEAWLDEKDLPTAQLTRREIQCLKWAASGKTDADIASLVDISVPTVRFHITNAWKKLQVSGKSQAIHRAASLGYIA